MNRLHIFLAPRRSLTNDNVCLCVTLFDSPTVFVKWLLGDQLFVDILYILANIPIYDGNLRLKIHCKNIMNKLRESMLEILNYRRLLNCRNDRLATPHRPHAPYVQMPPPLAPL